MVRTGRAPVTDHLDLLVRPIGPILNSCLRRENKLQYGSPSESHGCAPYVACRKVAHVPRGDVTDVPGGPERLSVLNSQ